MLKLQSALKLIIKIPQTKFKYQLILMMMVVILFLVISLSFNIYGIGRNASLENALLLSQTFTRQSMNNLKNVIKQFDTQCFQLYMNSALPELIVLSSEEKEPGADLVGFYGGNFEGPFYALDDRILSNIADMAYSTTAIESVFILDSNLNGYFFNKRGLKPSQQRISSFIANTADLDSRKNQSKWTLLEDNIMIERRIYSKTGSTAVGYISIEIRGSYFAYNLQFGIDERNSFAIFDEEGSNMFASAELAPEFISILQDKIVNNGENSQIKLSYKNQDYFVISIMENKSNLTMVNVISFTEMSKTWQGITWIIIIIGTITFVLALFISIFFARFHSKRIDMLVTKIRQIASGNFYEIATTSSYDEIGQIGTHLQELGIEMDLLLKNLLKTKNATIY